MTTQFLRTWADGERERRAKERRRQIRAAIIKVAALLIAMTAAILFIER